MLLINYYLNACICIGIRTVYIFPHKLCCWRKYILEFKFRIVCALLPDVFRQQLACFMQFTFWGLVPACLMMLAGIIFAMCKLTYFRVWKEASVYQRMLSSLPSYNWCMSVLVGWAWKWWLWLKFYILVSGLCIDIISGADVCRCLLVLIHIQYQSPGWNISSAMLDFLNILKL